MIITSIEFNLHQTIGNTFPEFFFLPLPSFTCSTAYAWSNECRYLDSNLQKLQRYHWVLARSTRRR